MKFDVGLVCIACWRTGQDRRTVKVWKDGVEQEMVVCGPCWGHAIQQGESRRDNTPAVEPKKPTRQLPVRLCPVCQENYHPTGKAQKVCTHCRRSADNETTGKRVSAWRGKEGRL
jgi:hypothetical protein